MSKPVPGSYIDTQGMGGPADPNYKGSGAKVFKPMMVKPQRLFTETYVKEMKILINEVLDEREYKRKLRMNYDDPKQPGVSYFDTEHFQHRINEPEPPYEDWSQ